MMVIYGEESELARVMKHINVSMARAHIKYGNRFETAYSQLLSSTPADPLMEK
jgi:hypothetical protein